MPPQTHKLRPDRATKRAIAQTPATIVKAHRGQPSRFTVYTVTQLLERHRDPRDVLLELASMETEELAKRAGCTYLEAFAERRLCAGTVLPYVASKMPVQVDMRHTKAIHLNIVDAGQYQQLQAIASDDSQAMQIVTGQAIESAIEQAEADDAQAADDGQRDVQSTVPAQPGSEGESSQ